MPSLLRLSAIAAVLSFATPAAATTYELSFESGDSADVTLQVGDVVSVALDTPELDTTIYGNVQIAYDTAALWAVYVDETPDYYGFWNAWVSTPADPSICGSGDLYLYETGAGSDWGDTWAADYGEGNAGPSAAIDTSDGLINFYHFNYLYSGSYAPLRIGFEVLATGTTTVAVYSQSETSYDWCDFDTSDAYDLTFGGDRELAEVFDELRAAVIASCTDPAGLAINLAYKLRQIERQYDAGMEIAAITRLEKARNHLRRAMQNGGVSTECGAAALPLMNELLSLMAP